MFITFYDRNFNAINQNSSLNVGAFTLVRRAYDFNEFSADCEPILLDSDPMFATLKLDDGTPYYDMLRPLIFAEKGKSRVVARDPFGIFNTECVIDLSLNFPDVKAYLKYIFNIWRNWDNTGFQNVNIIMEFETDEEVYKPNKKTIYNVAELFSKALAYYDLYIDAKINAQTKSLDFILRSNKTYVVNIRLEDFGINNFSKYEPKVNTATAVNPSFTKKSSFYLLDNGEITTNGALRNQRGFLPPSAKIFEAKDESSQEYNEAIFNAVSELAENRYQETIEIDTVKDYDRLKNTYFDTSFKVFYRGKEYKTLPVGEIEEKGTKNKTIRLGFKATDFIQII